MEKENKKHGVLLTVWVVLIIIINVIISAGWLWESIHPYTPESTSLWLIYVYVISGFVNVVFIVFLFRWKKWAFFAYFGSVVVVFILNVISGRIELISLPFSLPYALVGPAVLYWILHSKTFYSKWDLLE
ncbi:hypothetical protein A3A95_00360 [Candidatus Nomurabacteria bacterium RIFCSPLOWO2_01_FULL_39_18]|uniref:Uncharacterized protein n=1 Tax=Candidatus Nomurabacteria bacterium RIFCSPHIGHO2_01_FULL_40_24b TaxID=1801739 RepID=A0A1F6V971_9BACT|nr:MAG: hypothetical protein A2647_03210 [Candidatus Nomurabacteria bacterium RIFCSPHIGHO2_01_FULL_40_24b]OGI90527.1 MAG: hypothetical protein A3A95_00360 [Candidatus Nomurabacteria bacterium RIFCSPLOWO2_01_FULL_39_18]